MSKRSLAAQRGFFPQPTYLIGTLKDDGSANFALITFITFCSIEPPMLMFASRGHKLTRELVERNKVFSANLVTADMMSVADYFGTTSGYERDKCQDTGIQAERGSALNVPVLAESPWVYECALVEQIAVGDGHIYVGEVKNILVDDAIADTSYGHIEMDQVDPLIYAPGRYYGLTAEVGSVGCSAKHR